MPLPDVPLVDPETGEEMRSPRILKRSGHMQQAMRLYLHEVWQHGDENIALARIGRRRKTVYGYKRQFPEFEKEITEALEYHRSIARGEIVGLLPTALQKFKGYLEQDFDPRMSNANALAVLRDQGVLNKDRKQEDNEGGRPGVTKITYMDHPTFQTLEVAHDES